MRLLLVYLRADRGDGCVIGAVIVALKIRQNQIDTPMLHEQYQCYGFGPLLVLQFLLRSIMRNSNFAAAVPRLWTTGLGGSSGLPRNHSLHGGLMERP
jgi:hypothetical protein